MTATKPGATEDVTVRPLRKDAARNRALLVAAAREVFASRGLDATLDDVARHANVGVGTAYRHFANKYELAGAILDQVMDEVVADAQSCLECDDPWVGLVRFLEGVLVRQSADRGLREVLTGAKDSARMAEMHARISVPVGLLIERARAAGAIGDDVTVTDLGIVLSMLCTVADLGAQTHPDLWRRYLPALLAGLRPDGPERVVGPLTEAEFELAAAALHRHARAVALSQPGR
jgi:AcrR family transcriptional regulator